MKVKKKLAFGYRIQVLSGLEKLRAPLCLCMYHACKSFLTYRIGAALNWIACTSVQLLLLTKQHVKILTLKDLKYLQSYHALHKLASVHANLLWEGRKSNRGYIYFLKSQKQHYRHYKISLCFIVKYFCFETLFVEFNYVVVKYKLLYLRKVFILVHLKKQYKIYFNYSLLFQLQEQNWTFDSFC